MLAEPSRAHTGPVYAPSPLEPVGHGDLRERIQSIMWRCVGIIRSAAPLEEARRDLAALPPAPGPSRSQADLEVGNMTLVGSLMAAAAFARTESRGAHYREDYPDRSDAFWLKHIALQRGLGNGVRLTYLPVAG
jgi:L-aspartate oxidase